MSQPTPKAGQLGGSTARPVLRLRPECGV